MGWLNIATRSPIGLDIDGRFISAVQLSRSPRGEQIEAIVAFPRPDREAPVVPSELREVLKLLDRHGFRGRRMVVAVPEAGLMTDIIEVKSPDDTTIRDELARVHRWDAAAFEFASWERPASRPGARAASVMSVACPHDQAHALLDAFDAASCHVQALDVRGCALARACRPALVGTDGLAAIVDIGWTAATLTVLRGGLIVYGRELGDAGLNRLFMAMVNSLGLDPEIADHVLREIGLSVTPPSDVVDPARLETVRSQIKRYLDRVIAELHASFTYMQREYDDLAVRTLLLTGDGPSSPGLADYLADHVGIAAKSAMPGELCAHRPAVRSQCEQPLFCTALGLARYAWSDRS